jgi:S1-C subfamily serine protease
MLLILAGLLGYLIIDKGLGGRLWPWNKPDLTGDAAPRPVEARGDLAADEKATIDLYQKVSPSVVHISNLAVRRGLFNVGEEEVAGTGSGFIWSDSGLVVTNAHVVQNAQNLEVILSDKERSSFKAENWAFYEDKDLAVIKINAAKSKLHAIAVGTSHDLKVGQKTFAIGNPFGLDQTLTTGVVSALDREIRSVNGRTIQGVIQTSAPINPGNSGGPLLDSAGRLIGVNAAILSPSGAFSGIGFAIPVDEVNRVVPKLIAKLSQAIEQKEQKASYSPPKMGFRPAQEDLAKSLGVTEGVLILLVTPGSPAEKAGLRSTVQDPGSRRIRLGDVIVAIDDTSVKNLNDLLSILDNHQAGDTVKVTILRDRQRQDAQVTLINLR